VLFRSTGAFAGFGSGGSGSGAGAGGYGGGGGGWKGKPLVPLSTARPQMPDWACKQKLSGWVEALFVVMPNGRVQDVKIIDADPRGVFEAAAVESITNWIYEPTGKAAEVKQRVPMNHEDCAYNWR
jgi:TonB family protein